MKKKEKKKRSVIWISLSNTSSWFNTQWITDTRNVKSMNSIPPRSKLPRITYLAATKVNQLENMGYSFDFLEQY